MGLIHWWPLNGNLNDIGTGNAPLSGTPSYSSQGKIGQCLGPGCGILSIPASETVKVLSNTHTSITFWFNNNSSMTGDCAICGTQGNGNWGEIGRTWDFFNYPTKNDFHWSMGNLGGGVLSNVFTDNTWHHVAVIADETYLYIYIDAVLQYKGTHGTVSDFNGTYGIYAPGANYKLNDFRMYNHALSVKEIKEISKGLVLHYTFEDAYAEGTTNKYAYSGENPRWSPTFFDGASGNYNYGDSSNGQYEFVTTADKNGNLKKMVKVSLRTARTTNPYIFIDYVLPSLNGYVTVSFDYFATCGTQTIYPYSYRGNYRASRWDESTHQWIGGSSAEIGIPVVPNKWNHIVYRFTRLDDSYTSGPGYVRVGSSSSTSDYWLFDNIQVEEKDHATPYVNGTRQPGLIYDSSGYGRSATPVNNPQILNDSSSGLHCVDLTNASSGYYDLGTGTFNFITSGTVCFWAKYSDSNYKMILGANDSGSKYLAANTPNGSSSSGNWYGMVSTSNCYCDGEVYSKPKIDSQWHFYCFTGINFSSWGDLKYFLCIYANNPNNSFQFHGYLADFKIFATTLSAEDILKEYNRKASIDRNGNLFTGEFVAENGKTNISKTGVVESSHFEEGTSVVKMVDGYTELEYIQSDSSGYAYINTLCPIYSGDSWRVEMDLMMGETWFSGYQSIFNSTYDSDTFESWINNVSNKGNLNVRYNGTALRDIIQMEPGNKYNVVFNYASTTLNAYVNEMLKKSTTIAKTTRDVSSVYLTLGHSYDATTFKYYDVKLYTDGVLLRHLIPAKRKSDNAIGMYDTVNRKFYTNAGTGSFTAGPEKGNLSIVYSNELKEC